MSHLALERGELFWILDGVGADGQCLSERELGGCHTDQCRQTVRSFSLLAASSSHFKRTMQVVDGVAYYASVGLGLAPRLGLERLRGTRRIGSNR